MDSTTVYFSAFDKGFEVSSILAEFNLFGQPITIRWYGAIIAFGFLLAVLWGGRMAYKWKMSLDKMIDVLIYGTFAAIIGARLYYVVFRWDYYSAHPSEIIQIWNGGLAIYGGIIGGIIAAFITCKFNKLNFYNLLDCAGIDNMEICRDKPATPHYWNLVNCGDGWYHFDTCPHYKQYPLDAFMLTDAQVAAYSQNSVKDYYSFDASLYPATP